MPTKKKRAKQEKQSEDAQTAARRDLLSDRGGFDWGWPALGLVSATPELISRFRSAGFVGCGYGLVSEEGPPLIALIGENLSGMRGALSLIREWVDAAGPNAVNVEILLDGPGYVISISQQPDLLHGGGLLLRACWNISPLALF